MKKVEPGLSDEDAAAQAHTNFFDELDLNEDGVTTKEEWDNYMTVSLNVAPPEMIPGLIEKVDVFINGLSKCERGGGNIHAG